MKNSKSDIEGKNNTSIDPTVNGPYSVKNLKNLKNSKGEPIQTNPEMNLCRCGGSRNKPFCDYTHIRIGFRGDKSENREPDRMDDYAGKDITIHDNRGVCAHSGYCTDNSPAVFNAGRTPWIDPNAASADETAETIRMCPSGALSYTRDGTLYKDLDREPSITVAKDGPYLVVGGPELKDPAGCEPESKEHYTLCRCGGSRNKPFCDGEHGHVNFKDDKN
ncbi:CDGSH iron-sulfur domain-containing protein [Chloroflexota bacterium]